MIQTMCVYFQAPRQHASPSPVTMMSKSLIEPSAASASLWCDEMRRVPPVGAPASSAITADCIPECEMESQQQQPDSLEDTADETDDERQLDRRLPSSSGRVTGTSLCASSGLTFDKTSNLICMRFDVFPQS